MRVINNCLHEERRLFGVQACDNTQTVPIGKLTCVYVHRVVIVREMLCVSCLYVLLLERDDFANLVVHKAVYCVNYDHNDITVRRCSEI